MFTLCAELNKNKPRKQFTPVKMRIFQCYVSLWEGNPIHLPSRKMFSQIHLTGFSARCLSGCMAFESVASLRVVGTARKGIGKDAPRSQRGPPENGKSLYKRYSSWVCMGYNPQESLENTINTMGTLLGVRPIVPWTALFGGWQESLWHKESWTRNWNVGPDVPINEVENLECFPFIANFGEAAFFWWQHKNKGTVLQNIHGRRFAKIQSSPCVLAIRFLYIY